MIIDKINTIFLSMRFHECKYFNLLRREVKKKDKKR